MFDGGSVVAVVGSVFVPATLLVPGLLAVSVLARVVRHGVRLASTYVGSADRAQDEDTNLVRFGSAPVFGGLAGYTLWWVIGGCVRPNHAGAGGVMLAPLVALVAGSGLGVLLLGRTVLDFRLTRDGVHVRGDVA